MLRRSFFPTLALITLFGFTQCRTAQKYVESGDYDGAIDLSVSRLSGKKNKPEEWVKGLELAFQKATDRDMRAVEQLTAENRPENWVRIYDIHLQIHRRQGKVYPLLPLKDKKGYEAHFQFVNVEKLMTESREKAADYYYQRAQQQLTEARNGNKSSARNAFELFQIIEHQYFSNFRDVTALKEEAQKLGITHILFRIENSSRQVLPRDFNERVLAISRQDLDTRWKKYDLTPERGVQYDYTATLDLQSVDLSPERIRERTYTDEKEIKDGWEYVYDHRGNVKKDSAGNDIKHTKYLLVRAQVLEMQQTKAARIQAVLTVTPRGSHTPSETRPVVAETFFEHFAATFTGDGRALSEDSRRRMGNHPAPFPSDEALLAQAADQLKPDVFRQLRTFRAD